jgi:chromosome partitioning protein
MRNLLKAGLRRFVQPDGSFGEAELRHAIGDRHATVLAVAVQKGGVGKTTTTVSLAAALARRHDKRVLVIDLDPQGHVTTALRGTVRPGGGALSRVLLDEARRDEVMDIVATTTIPGLHLTPFDPGLAAAEDLLGARIGKEFCLRDALRVTRTHYDYILVDCPPNLGNLTLNGLCAADQVLIPCDPSPLAVKGVDALVQSVTRVAGRLNPEMDVLGILMTRVDGRNRQLNQAVVAEITERYGEVLLPVTIGIDTQLAKAQLDGEDVFAFAPGSRGAEQYAELADLVVQRLA